MTTYEQLNEAIELVRSGEKDLDWLAAWGECFFLPDVPPGIKLPDLHSLAAIAATSILETLGHAMPADPYDPKSLRLSQSHRPPDPDELVSDARRLLSFAERYKELWNARLKEVGDAGSRAEADAD